MLTDEKTIPVDDQIRMQLLAQAQRILEQQAQVEMAKSQGKSGSAPTTKQIIEEAELLYKFVRTDNY